MLAQVPYDYECPSESSRTLDPTLTIKFQYEIFVIKYTCLCNIWHKDRSSIRLWIFFYLPKTLFTTQINVPSLLETGPFTIIVRRSRLPRSKVINQEVPIAAVANTDENKDEISNFGREEVPESGKRSQLIFARGKIQYFDSELLPISAGPLYLNSVIFVASIGIRSTSTDTTWGPTTRWSRKFSPPYLIYNSQGRWRTSKASLDRSEPHRGIYWDSPIRNSLFILSPRGKLSQCCTSTTARNPPPTLHSIASMSDAGTGTGMMPARLRPHS